MQRLIKGLAIHTGETTLANGAILIDEQQIIEVFADGDKLPNNIKSQTYPSNYHLLPGMIDMHIHGSHGADVMDASSRALQTIADALLAQGTIAFLATTMTASIEDTEKAILTIKNFIAQQTRGAKILGIHLEGPFISREYHAAQQKQAIIPPDIRLFKHWQALSDNTIKLITIAPEEQGALDLISYCRQQNILTSLGHSQANYAEATAGIDAGISHATHLFNAMRGIHHREPGAVTALLLRDSVYTELITDGNHLNDAIIELTYKIKGADKLILVTDATRAQCLKDGVYELGGQEIFVKDNAVRLKNESLAGSVVTFAAAIKQMLKASGCDMNDIVKMVSTNPAKQLNLKNYGKIAAGYDANVTIMDENFNIVNKT